ncbi:putative F-box protein PP2-B12 [Bidens hawaiensis]|uniref:putative F-box protein PP2-B12 n=1 Tax=Bidens hawaiensis TaxID=980011 RepID=UPI00404ABFA0
MDGEHCEMISIAGCLTSASEPPHYIHSSECNSRFAGGCYDPFGASFKTRVQAQFLSPEVTYAVNLVFKNKSKSRYIGLEYKLKGELRSCYSFVSDEREYGWLAAELYQFTSDQRTVDLEIWFYTECCPTMLVEGIEFRPLKKADHEALMNDKVDMQLGIQKYFDDMLSDYEDMIKRSKDSVQWKTKKDLFSILCKGFQFSYGEEWFYLNKYGKKCLMLPARAVLEEDKWTWNSEPETRFEEVACCNFDMFGIYCKFSSKMLSPQTAYAAFLVYKLPHDHESVDQPPPVQVVDKDSDSKEVYNVFLRTPRTPVISWNEKEIKTFNPLNKPRSIKGLPKQRSDGWMEVQVHEFQTRATIKMVQKKAQAHESVKMISTRLKFSSYDMSLKGVIVQGLEFRPAV